MTTVSKWSYFVSESFSMFFMKFYYSMKITKYGNHWHTVGLLRVEESVDEKLTFIGKQLQATRFGGRE